MAVVVGYPYPADYFALDEYLPAIQMRLEIRGRCSQCLLQSRVLNCGRYSGHHGGLILWIPWAKYRCTLLKKVCWQCNVLVLTLDQEVCTALSLFSFLLTWPTSLLTLRSSKFGYFPYYMYCAWHRLTRWMQKRPWKTSNTLFVFVRMPSVYMALTDSDISLA